ncbi:MAG: hypothetical protein E5V19_06050 [Mesorhizobium sp.]|nr:MAG: hypothetical protein E5V19_06050 [Mesorhizobium sp.]
MRGPIAGMDSILISTAIDETGDDVSDTQSTPQVNLAFRILYFHIAPPIALNPSVWVRSHAQPRFWSMRPDIGATALE